MPFNEAKLDGSIEEGEQHLDFNPVEVIENALILNNWKYVQEKISGQSMVKGKISLGSEEKSTLFTLGKIQNQEEGRNPNEKRIQISSKNTTRGFNAIQDKKNIYALLGVYKRPSQKYDDTIIIAWPKNSILNPNKQISLRVKIQLIAKALKYGFVSDENGAGQLICAFRPEFLHYYIQNIQTIHSLPGNEINKNIQNELIVQKIYYGAPGTGKSYKVNELLKGKEERTERVTFHPEYDYASFIGGFKPITEVDAESGKEEIKYKFVPQTFTNIYVDAWNNKDNEYYLVIEEINRGNCAEIFGDIFQLLDRNSDYSITPSNELKQYLVKELTSVDGIKGIENGKMKLPSNLNILATMNTSDQSLFPMDSAFKRRWDWEYIPINYEKSEENPSSIYQVVVSDSISFSWLEFIEKVNTIIKENPNLGMDKCIGNYFIKAKDNSITLEEFINKAIFYLWNDVFKDEDDHIFEENTFYEDFFPIQTKGKEKVLKILDKIGLNTPEKED